MRLKYGETKQSFSAEERRAARNQRNGLYDNSLTPKEWIGINNRRQARGLPKDLGKSDYD